MIALVTGTRPQLIQDAMISHELDAQKIPYYLVDTGQHYDESMSGIFYEKLQIKKPKYQLKCGGVTSISMIAKMMCSLEEIFESSRPEIIMCNGDTNTTLASALVADRMQIPFAHPESGYRRFTHNIPEETNRVTADHIAKYLFAYTKDCFENLKNEGLCGKPNVICKYTGDVLYDAYLKYSAMENQAMEKFTKDPFILMTIHRNNNVTPEKIQEILKQVGGISHYKTIFPMHPRTTKLVAENNIQIPGNIIAISPVDYLEIQYLLKNASFIITDSGGLAREAHFAKKFCLSLDAGFEFEHVITKPYMHIVKPEEIIETFAKIQGLKYDLENQFGNGTAAKEIVLCLKK